MQNKPHPNNVFNVLKVSSWHLFLRLGFFDLDISNIYHGETEMCSLIGTESQKDFLQQCEIFLPGKYFLTLLHHNYSANFKIQIFQFSVQGKLF